MKKKNGKKPPYIIHTPSAKWDKNWDQREPHSMVPQDIQDETNYCEMLENSTCKAVRHLVLIRHGQYNFKNGELTDLGRNQAKLTGQCLASICSHWDLLIRSTLPRAHETGSIIAKSVNKDLVVYDCQMLVEGWPTEPEPPLNKWLPKCKSLRDNARIEAAFTKYIHRAPPNQTKDSYSLLVCHSNVIRYFVCKALQFPPEGWARMILDNGSITWLSIMPDGHVILRCLGDTGHMKPEFIIVE